MNQTEHYGLSQWALTDRVEMKDFNADNAKIDAALAALSGLQTSESARLDKAMAAAKTELTANLATAKTGLETSLGGKLEQVKLMDESFTASGSSYSIPVPGSEIAKCSLAMAVISSVGLATGSLFYAGSGTDSKYRFVGSGSTESGLHYFFKSRANVLVFFPMKGVCSRVSGISFAQDVFSFFYSSTAYTSFSSFTIKLGANASSLSGNVTLKIYGLR